MSVKLPPDGLSPYADMLGAMSSERARRGEPEGPQPLLREVPPGAPYPVGALGPLKAVVDVVQGMTQAPPAIAAQSALAVASLAVQGFANVQTLAGPRPLSLYCLTIARSGERKSTCDALLMEGLREHEREAAAEHRAALQSWSHEHAIWKGDRDCILAEVKSGKGEKRTASLADLNALGPEPSPPPSSDRTMTEPTFEGMTRLLADGQPSLGIFSDEGGRFLGGYAMNSDHKQKTLAGLNDLWHGQPIQRTRSGDGHSTLYGRRVAMHLMVQPSVASAFLADPMAADLGFIARFLICAPSSTIGTRFTRNARTSGPALDKFTARLLEILNTPMPIDPITRELQPRLLPLSPTADRLLKDFADAVEAAQAPWRDMAGISANASKAAEQAVRIAGVLTLWPDLAAAEVQGDTMADAITLMHFYLSEARRLMEGGPISAETANAELLRKWLVEKWPDDIILPGDILQKGPNVLRERRALTGPLAMLVKAGHLVRLPSGTLFRGIARKESYRFVRVVNTE